MVNDLKEAHIYFKKTRITLAKKEEKFNLSQGKVMGLIVQLIEGSQRRSNKWKDLTRIIKKYSM